MEKMTHEPNQTDTNTKTNESSNRKDTHEINYSLKESLFDIAERSTFHGV
jgi:hypothetical protein